MHKPKRRRIEAPRRGLDSKGVACDILKRQLHGRAATHNRLKAGKFRNFRKVKDLDTHVPEENVIITLPHLRKRSKIVELIVADGVIIGLTHTGVCIAFDQVTRKRLCIMNVVPNQVVRSVFHNRIAHSVITVSVRREDNFSSLQCSSTPLKFIRRGDANHATRIFEEEILRWPGFVEFDDVNSKVLTYTATRKVYKVWSLQDYKFLYSMTEPKIAEIKISPGIMLVIFKRTANQKHVPLQIRCIQTGRKLKAWKHELDADSEIEFIEQFDEKLLIKQRLHPLQIVDVRGSVPPITVPTDVFKRPKAFIFLFENQLFLTFHECKVSVWNFRGEKVTDFKNLELRDTDTNTNSIYINTHQDLIISYCQPKPAALSATPTSHNASRRRQLGSAGSINVSNILTGQCFSEITASADDPESVFALTDITVLCYSEERHEIYTGNKQGLIHVWTN